MHFLFATASPRQTARSAPKPTWGPFAAAATALLVGGPLMLGNVQAQGDKNQVTASINSSMDAGLFYQLLMGELEWQSGDAGASYQLILDAARKTRSEALFQRSTDIALQARAGEQALEAARAWQVALPESTTAHRYVIELLVALGRPAEAMEPLATLLKISSPSERLALLNSTPRLLTSAPQLENTATQLEQALKPYLDDPETRVAANVAIGRVWLVANNTSRALEFSQRAHAFDPQAEGPVLLALELMATQPAAMAVVDKHLQAKPDSLGLRLVYARALSLTQRYNEAIAQLNVITLRQPALAAPWLTLGALQLEVHHPREAVIALQTHLDKLPPPHLAAAASATTPATQGIDDSDPQQSRQQAWLLLAEASEQLGDTKAAQTWLNKVDDPKLLREVLNRRVQLLAKQGKVAQARALIRSLSNDQVDDRARVLMDTMVLRSAKQWSEAQKVLQAANQRLPNDVDLLYEQAMVEEKLNHLSEMERLLRKVIELKPDHHHAHNALGYSWADRNMRLPEAKALIQRALELAPADPFITDSLAWVEYRLGNRSEAVRLLRSAFKARPDPEIGVHLAEVLWVMGERDEAKRIFRDARKRDAGNEVLRETLSRLRIEL